MLYMKASVRSFFFPKRLFNCLYKIHFNLPYYMCGQQTLKSACTFTQSYQAFADSMKPQCQRTDTDGSYHLTINATFFSYLTSIYTPQKMWCRSGCSLKPLYYFDTILLLLLLLFFFFQKHNATFDCFWFLKLINTELEVLLTFFHINIEGIRPKIQ